MIGFQATVYTENDDDKYRMNIKLDGANLAKLSLLLASLHMIEKEILDAIDSIDPDYEIRRT